MQNVDGARPQALASHSRNYDPVLHPDGGSMRDRGGMTPARKRPAHQSPLLKGAVEQPMLDGLEPTPRELGFRGPQVCSIVGITYRQLDYWARTDLVRPSIAEARGSGTQRTYSFADLVRLKVVKS